MALDKLVIYESIDGVEAVTTIVKGEKDKAVSVVVMDLDDDKEIERIRSYGWGSTYTRTFAALSELGEVAESEGVDKEQFLDVIKVYVEEVIAEGGDFSWTKKRS